MACKDFGDSTLDNKFSEFEAVLVSRLQKGLPMSKGDKAKARRLLREAPKCSECGEIALEEGLCADHWNEINGRFGLGA